MKTINTIAFAKGAGKFFGAISFLSLSFFSETVSAQFAASPPGTTINSPLPLTIHGVYFGQGNSTAANNNNIAIQNALSASSTLNTNNIAIGNSNLTNLTNGQLNVSIGTASLQLMTAGTFNCSFGSNAMRGTASFSSVTANCAFGNSALEYVLSNSTNNCAFGNQALKGPSAGSSGKYNVGIGSTAGFQLSGDSNTVVGASAGYNITGNGNVALGVLAGLSTLTSGNRNVAIGYAANVQNATASNQLSIQNIIYGTGMNDTSTAQIGISLSSPSARLHIGGNLKINTVPYDNSGNSLGRFLYRSPTDNEVREQDLSSILSSSFCTSSSWLPRSSSSGATSCSQISDNLTTVQIGTGAVGTVTWNGTSGGELSTGGVRTAATYQNSSGNYRLYVSGLVGATAFIAYSDKRLKKNINRIESPLDKISKIKGYTYEWTDNFRKKSAIVLDEKQAGFVAQEIRDVLPEAVVENSDGLYGVNYNAVMPLLLEGIKEQQKIISELKLEIAEFKSKFTQSSYVVQPQNSKEYFQIIPNPVEQESKIIYKLDNSITKAMFIVYDLQGKMLKQMDLPKGTKEGQLPLNKNDLGKGMYILSLIINNDEAQSKRFLVL